MNPSAVAFLLLLAVSSPSSISGNEKSSTSYLRRNRQSHTLGDGNNDIIERQLTSAKCPVVYGSCPPKTAGSNEVLQCRGCFYAGYCEAENAGFKVDKHCQVVGGNDPSVDCQDDSNKGRPCQQTATPTSTPTSSPTLSPSTWPTSLPSVEPTVPTEAPTIHPTQMPTKEPTSVPTTVPTINPTRIPSKGPTAMPTSEPTVITLNPSTNPTTAPSTSPTGCFEICTAPCYEVCDAYGERLYNSCVSDNYGYLCGIPGINLDEACCRGFGDGNARNCKFDCNDDCKITCPGTN